ncbi:MAG: fatty acid desaturase [Gluconacetobacter sp.]
MLKFLGVTARHKATVNGRAISVEPGETLLQAALRQDIDFPYVCRVGGCGTCKCKLIDGRVREMTETGYLLTEDEIAEGYILACQSTLRTDVAIEVDLKSALAGNIVRGHVVGKTALTHDISRIDVQLDAALDYRAGQFAELSLSSLPGVLRTYSFATPPSADNKISFFIRRVPGGQFSIRAVDGDIVGEAVQLRGPGGAFWLRPGTGPVIMVAGGSGLAPILSMLKDAKAQGETRPATLLFGAREERDLYALDELAALERDWPTFTFVPVLSAVAERDAWAGERGMVTDYIGKYCDAAGAAYLCGPPGMVDAARSRLLTLGLVDEAIFADRFVERVALKDTGFTGGVVDAERCPAHWSDYLKYFMFHAVALVAIICFIRGGAAIPIGLTAIVAFYVLGDAVSGDDTSVPRFDRPGVLTIQLWLALPLLATIMFCAVWSASSNDPLGFGNFVGQVTGYDIVAARRSTTLFDHAAGIGLAGLMIGIIGTVTAHELTHRTWDPISMFVGRVLLAFSIDTAFAIEHVYGHHRYVSTAHDPATAPRGRNVYAHIVISTIRGNMSAWQIECERLRRKHLSIYSWHNAYLRGQFMSAVLLAVAAAIGGWTAATYFLLCALVGKALLEIVNYMEHYGMVRLPDQPVQPRHSWNTNKRISSWSMFNLTRHSHHHAQGEVPYQDLRPFPDAPMMVGGYLSTILLTLFPPLWHHLMTPKVMAWDRDHASPEERILAHEANKRSGMRAFRRYDPLHRVAPGK